MLKKAFLKNSTIPFTAFGLGFVSILSQLLLMRELTVVFAGNEIVYAVIFSSWMFWVGVGSFFSSYLTSRIKNPVIVISSCFLGVAMFLPLIIFILRSIKVLMGLTPGEGLSFLQICLTGFLIAAPVAILLGVLFGFSCLFAELQNKSSKISSAGHIYFWESVGAGVGGLVFNFVFIRWLTAVQIVFWIGLFIIGIVIVLEKKRKLTHYLGWGLVAVLFLFNFFGGVNRFDELTRSLQWKGFNLQAVTDSIYGNIALTKTGEEYSLFENGLLSFTTGDKLSQEESVHFALLQHLRPSKVLLIGNAFSGSLWEILRHPVLNVDCLELDPKVLQMAGVYFPRKYLLPSQDVRVHLIHQDARFFVKRAQPGYDVIIVNLGDPSTALLNRYYTLEFFKETKRLLNEGGVLSLRVSASENSLSTETRGYLRSLHSTLRQVFAQVKSIPGDTVIFLAASKQGVLTTDQGVLVQRLKSRKILTEYVNEYYLSSKLSPERLASIENVLQTDGKINTDLSPITYLYHNVVSSTHYDLSFQKIAQHLQSAHFWPFLIIPLALFINGYFLKKMSFLAPFALSILTTGFIQIISQLAVIFSFQAFFGFVYYKVGIIIALFMFGLALGSWCGNKAIFRIGSDTKRIINFYRFIQFCLCLYPLVLWGFLVFINGEFRLSKSDFFDDIFMIFPVWTGFIGGIQYVLSTFIMSKVSNQKKSLESIIASKLYGIDTMGSTIGALLAGIFLLPIFGIPLTCFFCSAIAFSILLIL